MAEVGAGSPGGTGSPVREPDPAGLSAAAAGAANVPEGQERKPGGMDAPRAGVGDDLKKIKGMGPALEKKCNDHGIWHYDQIAAWSAEEVAWADQNLVQFKGRVSRDDWVTQARILAEHEGSGRT
jgi:NADH-quinone oxidoreductase subunit E